MNLFRNYWKVFLLLLFFCLTFFIWYVVAHELPTPTLTIAFLNVGQGDALYIESPTRNKILIDGGPPRKIVGELRKVLPFYSKHIDTLVVTNPDTDHYAGFIDLLKTFSTKKIVESGTVSDTSTHDIFTKTLDTKKVSTIRAQRNMILDIGGGAYLRIIFPDRDVSALKTNDGSIIAQLVYGETKVLLTGDTTQAMEDYVLSLEGKYIKSDILKVAHHGSKTSSGEKFVQAVDPKYAIISAGKNNRYGHPHKETTSLFNKLKISVLGTYEEGTIVFRCDKKTCIKK